MDVSDDDPELRATWGNLHVEQVRVPSFCIFSVFVLSFSSPSFVLLTVSIVASRLTQHKFPICVVDDLSSTSMFETLSEYKSPLNSVCWHQLLYAVLLCFEFQFAKICSRNSL